MVVLVEAEAPTLPESEAAAPVPLEAAVPVPPEAARYPFHRMRFGFGVSGEGAACTSRHAYP